MPPSDGFFLNPFWRFVLVNPPPSGYEPSDTLVMVNHTSGADAWIAARAIFPWGLKFVFKADLLKVPIAGWALALSGDIPIHFTKEKGKNRSKCFSMYSLQNNGAAAIPHMYF